MGSSASSFINRVPPEFAGVFRAHAAAGGWMSFADFMALALFDPDVGYYSRRRTRIGYASGTDFFTASTSGPVFGELVAAACTDLLGGEDPGDFEFVELGAETEAGVLAGIAHGFGRVRTVRLGTAIELGGKCVVFSNELFDAQPFDRFIHVAGGWAEIGVALVDGVLTEVNKTVKTPDALPKQSEPGYVIDAPFRARDLLSQIAEQPWSGVFVACDYGKSWHELSTCLPRGTARAYFRHQQSNDLLARPGEQDLTCHICWDWMVEGLIRHGFEHCDVVSQEMFFIRRAGAYIANAAEADAARFSQRKQSLMQLLHPAQLGQRFQVLHAKRA